MSANPIPTNATEESRRLLAVARELMSRCPAQLGQEIAVTGSVARGLADRFSDIELVCWNEQIPNENARRVWLEEVGVEELCTYPEPDVDGTRWLTFRYRDTWLELGWGEYGPIEEILSGLLSAARSDHNSLQIASLICHAVPIRTTGRLNTWKERLSHYPDELQGKIIRCNTRAWADPHVPLVRWALAARGASMPLAMRLLWDMQNLWSVLYAINKRWEPDYKWTSEEAIDLPIKPDHLAQRLNGVFTLTAPERNITDAYELILEVLDLVPPEHDVSSARASIKAAMNRQQ